MSKIIPLDDKMKSTAAQKAAEVRKQKLKAAFKFFQCSQCLSKCERCGIAIEGSPLKTDDQPRIPYHFCYSCAEEYIQYIKCLQGQGDQTEYWHNQNWLKVWQTWIEYQGAKDQYLRSKEFRRLMDELAPDDLKCD